MSHGHGAAPDPSSRRARRIVAGLAAVLVLTAIGLVVLLWPDEVGPAETYQPYDVTLFDAHVTSAETVDCPGGDITGPDSPEVECSTLRIRLETGPDAGDEARINYVESPGSPPVGEGDDLVVGFAPQAAPEFRYYVADFQRETPLLLLAILFVVAVLLLARLGGLRALLGAVASLVVIVTFVIPALLGGENPVLIALVASGLIAVLALYLTHGVNHRTNVAFLGTVASLGLTAALAAVFVAATHLTGLVQEDVAFLQIEDAGLDVTGLLLAGIVIGALGVLDDVTVTQVAAVWELHAADPTAPARRIYRSAVRIGRDHISSTVNTLVLAYAGAALPLLLLFQRSRRPVGDILTGEAIATEIVRALVGSIGLVASVPITTALAVAVVGASRAVEPAEPVEEPVEPPPPEPEPEPAVVSWEDFGPEERHF
jgi:uncharacterized membrane protein